MENATWHCSTGNCSSIEFLLCIGLNIDPMYCTESQHHVHRVIRFTECKYFVDIVCNGLCELPVSVERIAQTTPIAWQQNISQTAVCLNSTSQSLSANVITFIHYNLYTVSTKEVWVLVLRFFMFFQLLPQVLLSIRQLQVDWEKRLGVLEFEDNEGGTISGFWEFWCWVTQVVLDKGLT